MSKTSYRYLCIHGHFYQPPRENPWADIIYIQKSAYPYHDWNERITRECYGPNTRSRLHGENGYISKLINNFELINFNFGPTLLTWLEKNNPWIYSQIITADRLSIDRFGGHGNAMAQVYNHLIMPLASERDKITQVKWGLADFYYRFNRKPEGMWLAETAADSRSLAVLAREGIRYTILSPYQAHLVKPLTDTGSTSWQDVSGGKVDCTRPYRCFPTDDKNLFIDLFFYNGPLSKAIAYEKILASGEAFLTKIMDAYPSDLDTPALVSMATDGESYGHHFKFGEMALTWVLEMVNNGHDIKLTNYGEFLEKFPPEQEIKIIENSAWSCAHGIERWRSNCGCSVSQNSGWTQSWRTPLRSGLDWLNNHLSSIFEEKTKGLLKDCWETRNDYINLLLKPEEIKKETFLQKHAAHPLNTEESEIIFQLLESQQMALYMFTSCGWFFDDISGLEPVQILMYAKKAIELCKNFSEEDLEKDLTSFLSEALCNDPRYKNGMDVYNKKVIPMKLDSLSLLANCAMVSVIDDNQIPRWVMPLIKLDKQETIKAESATVFLCEGTEINTSLGNGSCMLALSLWTADNQLLCIAGTGNESTIDTLLKEIDSIRPFKQQSDALENIFKKHVAEAHIYTVKDLLPDIKSLVIKMLSDRLADNLYGRFSHDINTIENYLKAVSLTDEDVPVYLNDFLYTFFLDMFLKLFKKSENILIEFGEIENLLELFNREPEEDLDKHTRSICDHIVKQKKIALRFEEYLVGQTKKIQINKINPYLNNIIKTVNFINKYKVEPDWWTCQNLFYELRTDMDFINNLDKDNLNLFRQIEHLLWFTGGN